MLKETGEASGREIFACAHANLLDYAPQPSCLHWWQCTHLNPNSTQVLKIPSKRFHYDIALK